MGRKLREVAELWKNPSLQQPTPHAATATPDIQTTHSHSPLDNGHTPEGDTEISGATEELNEENDSPAPSPLKSVSQVKVTKAMSREDKVTDLSVTADEILLQLARESASGDILTEPLRAECVKVEEEGGQAVITYEPSLADEDKNKSLVEAAAAGEEFDCDCEIYQDTDRDSGVVTKYFNYTRATLGDLLFNQPDRFKHCAVHIEGDNCVASVLDPLDPVQEIEVKGSLRRGRAFDKDEVVVEVLPEVDMEDERKERTQGQVVGITQRAIDHRSRSFVCAANTGNLGLLNPINPGVPPIYNALLHKHVQRVKKGFMCVYQLRTDNTLTFSHYEKVEANDIEGKLFVVRYLKWLPGFFNPVGVVVGVISAGHNLTSALNILSIEHHLPTQFSSQVMQEVESSFHDDYTLPADVYSTRINLTESWCFTINPPNTNDIQVAFSIDQVSETSYQVCVHVSDVAYFVQQGTELDEEAFQRGTSAHPIGANPVPLLPEQLSSQLCSLQQGKDRCALSVFMTVEGTGQEWHIKQACVQQTVVNCKQSFTYHDVEAILDDVQGTENDYFKSCVLVLYQIAHMQRKQRRGVCLCVGEGGGMGGDVM